LRFTLTSFYKADISTVEDLTVGEFYLY